MDNINLSRNLMVLITKEMSAITWLLINKKIKITTRNSINCENVNRTVETFSIILLLLTPLFPLSQFQNVATQIETKM